MINKWTAQDITIIAVCTCVCMIVCGMCKCVVCMCTLPFGGAPFSFMRSAYSWALVFLQQMIPPQESFMNPRNRNSPPKKPINPSAPIDSRMSTRIRPASGPPSTSIGGAVGQTRASSSSHWNNTISRLQLPLSYVSRGNNLTYNASTCSITETSTFHFEVHFGSLEQVKLWIKELHWERNYTKINNPHNND